MAPKPIDPAKKAGNAWAPELHYIDGKWYLVACMGDQSTLTGSFILVSDGGPEGPYRNIQAWVARMKARPAFEPTYATFYTVMAAFKAQQQAA